MTILNTIKLTAISIIASSLLVGCGSSDSTTESTYQTPKTILSGIASDPELQGANVYLDVNEDGVYQSTELNTTTDVNGSYTLVIPEADLGKPVIVEGGIDAVTKEAFDGQLSMVAQDLSSGDNITPLTTLVKEYKVENPTMSLDDVKAELATKLDISTDDLDKDTTATGNEALLQVALQVEKVVELIADSSATKDVNDTYNTIATKLKTQDLNAAIDVTVDATTDLSDLAKAKAKDLSDELSKLDLGSTTKDALAFSVEKINDTIDKVTNVSDLATNLYNDSSMQITSSDEIQTQARDAIYTLIGLDNLDTTTLDQLNTLFEGIEFDFSDATPQDVVDKINDDTFMGSDTDFNADVRASLIAPYSASGSISTSL